MEEALAFIAVNSLLPPPSLPVYAVARGTVPGIYALHQQATAQTSGFRNAMQRCCATMEEAQAYITANRRPEPVTLPLFVLDHDGHNDMND